MARVSAHTNSTRVAFRPSRPHQHRPISAVVRTCVPPQALRSTASIETMRNVPSRSLALRSPAAERASSNVTVTGRASATSAFARRSAFTIC